MTFPDRVTVYHRLASNPEEVGGAFTLEVLLLSERYRRVTAKCVEDIVVYDYRKAARAAELPAFMREAFVETWELQERERREQGARVGEVLRRVRELERGSWNREGAVEDMGSAR